MEERHGERRGSSDRRLYSSPGRGPVTHQAIADALKIDRTAVTRILGGVPCKSSPRLRERVIAAARAMGYIDIEKRRKDHPRFRVAVPAEFTVVLCSSWETFSEGKGCIVDLSTGGCLLDVTEATQRTFPLERCEVRLRFSADTGAVCHMRQLSHRRTTLVAIGLQFMRFTGKGEALIADLLREAQPSRSAVTTGQSSLFSPVPNEILELTLPLPPPVSDKITTEEYGWLCRYVDKDSLTPHQRRVLLAVRRNYRKRCLSAGYSNSMSGRYFKRILKRLITRILTEIPAESPTPTPVTPRRARRGERHSKRTPGVNLSESGWLSRNVSKKYPGLTVEQRSALIAERRAYIARFGRDTKAKYQAGVSFNALLPPLIAKITGK